MIVDCKMKAAVTIVLHLSTILLGVSAKNNVPVLIWDPQSPPGSLPSVPSLQSLSFKAFEKYLNDFHPDNIILFLQDMVSIEDLTAHTEFSYLSEWVREHKALYLPSVEDPSNLIDSFTQKGYHVQKVETGSSLAALDLKKDNNLVIVKLPDTKNNNDRSEALRKSDEVMASTLSKIDQMRNFKVIFTAVTSSLEEEEELEHTRIARSLKATPDKMLGMHAGECTRVYMSNDMTLTYAHNNTIVRGPWPEIKASNDSEDCGDDRQVIIMKYRDTTIGITEFDKLNLELRFTTAGGSWSLSEAIIHSIIAEFKIVNLNVAGSGISGIPIGRSYSCSSEIVLKGLEEHGAEVTLTFNGLQIQAFSTDKSKFGPSFDCVGFFTVPIWCGLLASFLAATILLWALYMLAEVKTMDRFDDPKGTPIVFTNVQE
ncbi:V-type proton ATPase subunit S1-like isoform X2 [Oratosquilla oratoria]|uniref:V-type proton ATPase subunit S1-like isoform X2 n=1 Tax=Oratosquilla oratoria TaxID=337810 RepID=UPI003F75DB37